MNINLFWFDGPISNIEKLTLKSIIKNNMIPVIWAYNKSVFSEFKNSAILNDANDIITKDKSFLYKGNGNTNSSFGCGFTDIFRAKLIYEVGGWYSDFDITFLNNLELYNSPYIFRPHIISGHAPSLFKAPKNSLFCKDLYEALLSNIDEDSSNFFKPLTIFSQLIKKHNLSGYTVNKDIFGDDNINDILPLLFGEENTLLSLIHWCNSFFTITGVDVSLIKPTIRTLSKINSLNLINKSSEKLFFNWNEPIINSYYYKLIKEYEV